MENIYYTLYKIRNWKKWFNNNNNNDGNNNSNDMEIKIVGITNNFDVNQLTTQNIFGYRDIVLNIVFTNKDSSVTCELRLQHNKFEQFKANSMGYANYLSCRFLIDCIVLLVRYEQTKNCNVDNKEQQLHSMLNPKQEIVNDVLELLKM